MLLLDGQVATGSAPNLMGYCSFLDELVLSVCSGKHLERLLVWREDLAKRVKPCRTTYQ